MLVKFEEHSGCFGISLEPETKEEVVQLVRLEINKTKSIQIYVGAHRDNTLTTDIVITKKKRETSAVCK